MTMEKKSFPMSSSRHTDHKMPGTVYLCQVSEEVSCGACCGLYNVANPSFGALTEMLTRRTEIFSRLSRDMDTILAFKEEIEAIEPKKRPFPQFHHCPYLGFIGRKRSRVGCLLHPMAHGNEGIDFRGLSFYGGMACRVYFCPSHTKLPAAFKAIVCEAAGHWYLYGMVITETDMLNAFFGEVERQSRRPITRQDVMGNETCLAAVREFLGLKLHWPFRAHAAQGLCHYFFGDALDRGPTVDYGVVGGFTSRYDTIFRGLASHFHSEKELREAEDWLEGLINRLASNISAVRPQRPVKM